MTTSHASDHEARRRVALRLLDHQIVGPDDQLLGNVDDLRLAISEDGWAITGLLVGPAALGQRLPGRLGRWTTAVWRRLQTSTDPGPAFVPMAEVTDIGSAIRISHPAAEVLAQSFGLELWLRTYVVSRIPGAQGGGEDDQADADPASSARRPESPGRTGRSDPAVSCVSDILGSEVRGTDGVRIGVLNELFCVGPTGDAPRDLRVTHVEYSDHLSGSELGYNDDSRQGPAAVGIVIRRWQRGSRVSPLDDVTAVDLEAGVITVARHHEHVHPHQL